MTHCPDPAKDATEIETVGQAVPVAIEIRASATGRLRAGRFTRPPWPASCAKRPSRSIKLIQIKQHIRGAE